MSIDCHLKLAGVTGEATQKNHENEIEVQSWTWGLSNEAYTTGGGSGKGKATPGLFTITKRMDKATPTIAQKCVSGKHFDTAVLTSAKSGDGQKDFMTLTFKEVFIVGYQVMGGAGADIIETISMSYADVELGYKPQDGKGGLGGEVKFGWNVKTTDVR